MRMAGLVITLSLFLLHAKAEAYFIDTIAVPSQANGISVKTIVILPNKALGENAQGSPVVYLLHGYDDNETGWLSKKKNLPEIADEKNIIIVCPNGKNSWYLDSPIKKDNQYETFISSELVNYIDKHYRTIPNRKYRAITGLSMGGHGALYNAFKHKDVFGAVGSMSGAIDIKQKNNNYGLTHLLPSMVDGNSGNWGSHSVLLQIAQLKNQDLAIIIDCGLKDFAFSYNDAIHKALIKKEIDHDYTIRPGNHSWSYWHNSIDYHLLFFYKYFTSHQNKF
jgi:S-formylglutathione hydrolase FrmB